jgi:hypothetical protein
MSQEKYLVVNFYGLRFVMHDDPTFLLQIAVCPEVMIAREEMYFHSHIGQLREFSQKAGVPFGYHIFVFVPEVKHIA